MNPLTFAEHAALGNAIREARKAFLSPRVFDSARRTSMEHQALLEAIRALDRLRDAMDRVATGQYRNREGVTRLYFGM